MVAALVRNLPAYDPATDCTTYEMAETVLFAANGIREAAIASRDPDRRIPALLTCIGIRALDILRFLCS